MASPAAAPLIAADAVVLDVETTGLDPRSARIVQIGAVKLHPEAGEPDIFVTFVKPDVVIPASATAIHHIAAADVADAPPIAEALRDLLRYLGERPLIGHAVAFDIAVLAAEAKRAGVLWRRPRSLDTRHLAELVAPTLPSFTIETLCSWLGLAVDMRHSAIGDARMTAAIFGRLLPLLRERGIRTWAEAEAACRVVREAGGPLGGGAAVLPDDEGTGDRGSEGGRSGDGSSGNGSAANLAPLARIDSFPYRHRVADIMSTPPQFLAEDASLRDAATMMDARGISSVFLRHAGDTGILTERDVIRALASDGADALGMPAAAAASFPLCAVPAAAFIYRAMGRMDRLGVRHLGVVDEAGVLVGALSARDLLRLRTSAALRLGDAVDAASDMPALARAWGQLPAMAEALLAEGVPAAGIAAVISRELGAATRRAAQLAEAALAAEGRAVPGPYALLVLGSAGRGESLLSHDQDNAIIFADGDPEGSEDGYFADLGRCLAEILDQIGIVYCRGGVMAREPDWRGSVATWQERIAGWLRRSSPEDLLSVDIFYDARTVHGDPDLAGRVMAGAFSEASRTPQFLKLLADASPEPPSAFGLFGGLRTEGGRIDLKRAAMLPVVSAARVLALRHGRGTRGTVDRLREVAALGRGGAADLVVAAEGYEAVLEAVLRQQVRDVEAGVPPTGKVDPSGLPRDLLDRVKDALRIAGRLHDTTRELLF